MDTTAPNLYTFFKLNPQDSCVELGLLLAGKSAMLTQSGFDESSSRYLNVAYGILSDEHNRVLYDDMVQQRKLTWEELEYLANFGDLTVSVPLVFSNNQSEQPYRASDLTLPPFPMQTTQSMFGVYPVDYGSRIPAPTYAPNRLFSSRPVDDRPTGLTRFAMTLLDLLIRGLVFGVGIAPFVMSDDFTLSGIMLWTVCSILYAVGFEISLGATPAKLICGYTVRDIITGRKLSWKQSVKRNWWRLLNIVPGLGYFFSFIASVVNLASINRSNELRGLHDQLADAEVTKRS